MIIPATELRHITIDEDLRRVAWLTPPSVGNAALLECFFSPSMTDVPTRTTDGAELLFAFPLQNGETFSVFFRVDRISQANQLALEAARNEIISNSEAKAIEMRPEYRAVALIHHESGTRGLIELVPYKQTS